MAEPIVESIELSPEDHAYVVAEAARCGKTPSEVVHDAVRHLRDSDIAAREANLRSLQLLAADARRKGSPDLAKIERWLADPDGGGLADDDPLWSTVGLIKDDPEPVSTNVKHYLHGGLSDPAT